MSQLLLSTMEIKARGAFYSRSLSSYSTEDFFFVCASTSVRVSEAVYTCTWVHTCLQEYKPVEARGHPRLCPPGAVQLVLPESLTGTRDSLIRLR